MAQEDVARAIAFFETTDDAELLRDVLRSIRPRAAAEVRRLTQKSADPPAPAVIASAASPATREEALATLKQIQRFDELQAISRAAGRRLEAIGSFEA